MKELVYPRLLLQRAEQFADKVAFIDVSGTGITYEGTFENHMDRLVRLANSMRDVLGFGRETVSRCLPRIAISTSSCTTPRCSGLASSTR